MMKIAKTLRSALSLLLVISMLFGTVGTALAVEINDGDDDGVIRYVSLGASNTNGYGIRGYLPAEVTADPLIADKSSLNVYGYERAPESAYPAQVAAELEAATGKEVVLNQLAISSMRVEEVRMLLDENYYGDDYTAWRFYNENGDGWFAQAESGNANTGAQALANLRSAYQSALTNADVISVDMGLNNFGVFAFNNVKNIMADGRFWKEPDFSLIMDVNTEINYNKIKTMVKEQLLANVDGLDSALITKLDMVADTLTYAAVGFCYNFDIVMDKIYTMNPDAEVVVVSIQNMLHGVDIEFEGVKLPLGDIYGQLIDIVNLYTSSVSPYSDTYSFAYVSESGHATTFLDELLAWNGDPETLTDNMKDCFDMYDDDLYVRSIIEYVMVAPALGIEMPASLQQMIATGNIDVGNLDMSDPDLVSYVMQAAQKLSTFRYGKNLANDQEKAVYNAYVNTLNTAYGIVATVLQEAAKIDTIQVATDSMNGFGKKSDQLMAYVFGEVITGAQTTFMSSLTNPNYEYSFKMDEDLLSDPIIAAVAVLATRFDIGNSFFAHPSEQGHDELTASIITALESDTSGRDFVVNEVNEALKTLYAELKKLGVEIADELKVVGEDLVALAETVIEQAKAAKAEFEAEIEALKAELAEKKAELEAAVGEVKAEIEANIAQIEAAIEELEAKSDAIVAQLKVLYQAAKELKAAAEAAVEEGIAAVMDVKAAVEKVIAEVRGLIDVLPTIVAEKLDELDAAIMAALTELYNDATTAAYTADEDSYYVAIGDATAASESYVDLLAAELGVDYKNLAGKEIDAAEIAKADLVTLGYGANYYNNYLLAVLKDEVVIDWTAYVTAEEAAYIEAALADVNAYLLENGLDEFYAGIVTTGLEAYAYAYITYVTTYPETIDEIHAINPEALVVIVGMYNPLEGLVVEGTDVGAYFQYIVDATNLHTLAYAMLNENVIYVDAPAVETVKTVADINELLVEVGEGFAGLNPSEAGHEYIKTQIANALTPKAAGLLGDANGDGVVNNIDAMLVLQHYAGLDVEINTELCDVDGNGSVNNVDAMLILQYYAEIITDFPVEA